MINNLPTPRGGIAKNQYVVDIAGILIFQSFNSIIYIRLPDGSEFLGTHYNYSTTTSKYLNIFLRDYNVKLPTTLTDSYQMHDIIRAYINNKGN